ncbi:MAG: hypothetical protein Edafosvirus23_12 [Edafosvirus sp.]|uniref:Uncharacterized protein n=1 Tax=Edafosvirus sp. TaxID=2487765 RepID=A0A3G4ZYL9_9VIRU|nr:MAG: hypothetical protein Edafosvirus23_12 [Edafosvirus sp.]
MKPSPLINCTAKLFLITVVWIYGKLYFDKDSVHYSSQFTQTTEILTVTNSTSFEKGNLICFPYNNSQKYSECGSNSDKLTGDKCIKKGECTTYKQINCKTDSYKSYPCCDVNSLTDDCIKLLSNENCSLNSINGHYWKWDGGWHRAKENLNTAEISCKKVQSLYTNKICSEYSYNTAIYTSVYCGILNWEPVLTNCENVCTNKSPDLLCAVDSKKVYTFVQKKSILVCDPQLVKDTFGSALTGDKHHDTAINRIKCDASDTNCINNVYALQLDTAYYQKKDCSNIMFMKPDYKYANLQILFNISCIIGIIVLSFILINEIIKYLKCNKNIANKSPTENDPLLKHIEG